MFAEQTSYFESLQGPPDPEFFVELSARYGTAQSMGRPWHEQPWQVTAVQPQRERTLCRNDSGM